ncbi:MAG: response regulator [Gammaproteobacteria bacterium]|nr:response regulator [Gammaproteobacteria bacterium]
MLRLDQNAKIRLNILLIALLGGLGFLCYLLVNVYLAQKNGERLDNLLTRQYPVIEQIRHLKQDAQAIRDSLTAAVGLEDAFMVEDSQETATQFRERLRQLQEMEPALTPVTQGIGEAFDRYYDKSQALALELIENQDNLSLFKRRVDDSHRDFAQLAQRVDDLQHQRQQDYEALLLLTNAAVKDANLLGAILGALAIAGLGLLAWTISVRVLVEINRSNRLKNEFLATISHELRTPMNGIIGALNLLRSGSLAPEQSSWVGVASRAASAMMMSIDDILQFSEILSGQSARHDVEFDLRAALEKLLATFKPEFAARQLAFIWHLDEALPRTVRGDEQKILHVVRQLVSNALKFTESGRVEVRVSVDAPAETPQSDAEHMLCVRVQDSGPGIAPERMRDLFQPFQQLDGAFNRRYQGMGIGLAICRAIATLLGGTVELRTPGQGGVEAEFRFPVGFKTASAVTSPVPVTPVIMSDALVLVAEDNPVNQMVLKGYLAKLGFRVVTAGNGLEAVAAAQNNPLQLVLMDCQMPVMDGFEATRRIRQLPPPVGQVPIIAVTANALETDRQNCLGAGMNGYLKKPVDIEALRASLQPYLAVPAYPAGAPRG